jgi:adenylosuccinate lyase
VKVILKSVIWRLNNSARGIESPNGNFAVDGRYFELVKPLTQYFSEYGLIRYRVQIEIEYLIALSATIPELEDFPAHQLSAIRKIYKNFTEEHATQVKAVEKITIMMLKAVELFYQTGI